MRTLKLVTPVLIVFGIGTLVALGDTEPAAFASSSLQQQPEIRLKSRSFSPTPGVELELKRSLTTTERRTILAILQTEKPLSLNDHSILREYGILLEDYLGGNAYIASIPGDAPLGEGDLGELVRWAGSLRPTDKLETALAEDDLDDWALDESADEVGLLVEFESQAEDEVIRRDLESLGLTGERHGGRNLWAVTASEADIRVLAELESVKYIQQGPMPFLPLPNDGGRRVANTNEAQQATYTNPMPAYSNVSGQGIRIGICDSGVDESHDDFDVITAAGIAGASRVYNQRAGGGSHGTHVASIAAGNGIRSANNGLPAFDMRGHAPRAGIGDYPNFGSDAQRFFDAIVNDNTDVTNHSYVQSHTVYDAEASSLDVIVRGDGLPGNATAIPARPQVWAAGNNGVSAQYGNEEGYYAVFTSAKNTISVGSIDTRNGRLSDFSSLGPTFDGRIKPDIVAPGCLNSIPNPSEGIQAVATGTQGYTGKCGTSMAAPVVSGVIALMMEQFQAAGGVIPNVLPATYKAILVHTAADKVKTEAFASDEFNNPDTDGPVLYHAGPDYATGFGLVDADGARRVIARTGNWRQSALNQVGATHTYCIDVPEGTDELKVVIAWDDEAASTLAAHTTPKLVNDLDLQLIDPNGNVYLPWTVDPLPLTASPGGGGLDPISTDDVNPAKRAADHLNNVEMASVPLPIHGRWRTTIRAFSLPNGNAQSYSFVSSEPIAPLCFVGPFAICERYPWICRADFEARLPYFRRGEWFIDPKFPTPIDEICKYVIDCPGCRGRGQAYCPGWDIQIDQLPSEAIVTVLSNRGDIVAADSAQANSRRLRVARRFLGKRYYIVVTDRSGDPYEDSLRLRIDLKSLSN